MAAKKELEDQLLRALALHNSGSQPYQAAKSLSGAVDFATTEVIPTVGGGSALCLHNLLAELTQEIDPAQAEGMFAEFSAMVETSYGASFSPNQSPYPPHGPLTSSLTPSLTPPPPPQVRNLWQPPTALALSPRSSRPSASSSSPWSTPAAPS